MCPKGNEGKKEGEYMNELALRIKMVEKGLSIPGLADSIGMARKTIYKKMREETFFTRKEIVLIATVLELKEEEILEIFFTDLVS